VSLFKVNEIFINEVIVYRFIQENKIFENYSPTMVHGKKWGLQQDIVVKMTHATTEEEIKERYRLVKKRHPALPPTEKLPV
jgi:hypothetical protein